MTDPQLPPPSGDMHPESPVSPVPPTYPAAPVGRTAPAAPGYPVPPTSAAVPGYAASSPAPGYPAVPGYPAAPPGAYQVPVGGYAAPAGAYAGPETTTRPSGVLGTLALVLALIAAIVMPLIVGVSAFAIGRVIPPGMSTYSGDLRLFSPVRDQVLWAELSFWGGTVLGIAAIVLGIIAIRKKQGRGAGIAALVVAVVAAVIFSIVLIIALGAGSATGLAGYTT